MKKIAMTLAEYRDLPRETVFKEPTQIVLEDGTNTVTWRPLPLKEGMRIWYNNKIIGVKDYGTILDPYYVKEEPIHFHDRKKYICTGIRAILDCGIGVEVYFDETQLEGTRVNVSNGIEVQFLGLNVD